MIFHCYCLRDRVLKIWRQPAWDSMSPDDLPEAYRRLIQSPTTSPDRINALKGHALFHLADFDDMNGKITVFDDPSLLCDLTDYFPVKGDQDGENGK